MTLVLTELSHLGIAMAADSAVTYTNSLTGLRYAQPNRARKLQEVPHLNAGVSCWGLGSVAGLNTDQWLSRFVASSGSLATLQDFANELARQLNNRLVPPNTLGDNRLGFQLAGFEDCNGVPTPSFYHIHDGPSTVLQSRGTTVNPYQFNANHDMPPQLLQQLIPVGGTYTTRNGDYQLYAQIFARLEALFTQLQPLGIQIPSSQNLVERAEYLVFQIRTMSELYRLSNLVPGIGGGIWYLTINPTGIHSYGVKYF